MSRKNIFDLVANTFDLSHELARMKRLFEKECTVPQPYRDCCTILWFVKEEGFSNWKNRGRCVDVDDYFELLRYKELWKTAATNVHDLLLLIEILYNFWHITSKATSAQIYHNNAGRNFILLKKIMDECLAQFNYKGEYFPSREQLIVIEDKPEVTAVAEIVKNEIAYKVLRYNHYMLKGKLQAKKEILLAMGEDLEPKRKDIQQVDRNLEDGIFYMLNNLHLRHNNKTEGDKNYRAAVAEMSNATMEKWYDELYQMMLLAYLQLDQVDRNIKMKVLKELVTP